MHTQRELVRYREERSGIRDEYQYSNRHGLFFEDDYMMNVDFMEMKGTKAVLAGDLKHSAEKKIDLDSYRTRCYTDNFSCALVYLYYYYWDAEGNLLHAEDVKSEIAHAQYYVIAMNKQAEESIGAKEKWFSEIEWIRYLHKIHDSKNPIENEWFFSKTLKYATQPFVYGEVK